jgi:hypothetical protein
MTSVRTTIRQIAILLMVMALGTAFTGCGGGSSSESSSPVEGVAVPSGVSVVTAKNAD